MSYTSAITVATISAAYAGFYAVRSVNSGKPPSEIAYWGAGILCVGFGTFIYIFVFSAILGERLSEYLQPNLLGSRAERGVLFIYATISAGLAMIVSAGLANIMLSRKA